MLRKRVLARARRTRTMIFFGKILSEIGNTCQVACESSWALVQKREPSNALVAVTNPKESLGDRWDGDGEAIPEEGGRRVLDDDG